MDGLWTASVVAEAPAGGERLSESPEIDEHTELVLGELGVRPLLVAHGPDWWGIAFTLESPMPIGDPIEEYGYVVQKALFGIYRDVAAKTGLPSWPIAKIEVLHGEGRPNIAPTHADPDQAWYWTPEWQAGERRAAREVAEGRVRSFESAEDFLKAL